MSLVANSYATSILNHEMRAEEFAVLGRLVAGVAIRSLKVPEDVHGFEPLLSLMCATIQTGKNRSAEAVLKNRARFNLLRSKRPCLHQLQTPRT